MAQYPQVFPRQMTSVLRAGELGADMPGAFTSVRDYLEWLEEMMRDVRQASIYPMISTNARRYARAFLIDPGLSLNGGGLPFRQPPALALADRIDRCSRRYRHSCRHPRPGSDPADGQNRRRPGERRPQSFGDALLSSIMRNR